MQYPPSELVLNTKQQVYHLGLHPEELAAKIILVGDQDRVALVSAFFDEIEHESRHREFVCHTGTYRGQRISVISTGIGTDNIDIVINELDALVNIDLQTRTDKAEHTSLQLVRIGTCGILQPEIPVHSYLLSTHALGLDNVAHFYKIYKTAEELALEKSILAHLKLPSAIQPYIAEAGKDLVAALSSDLTFPGITVTSSGFYAPQGRALRLELSTTDLNEKLQSYRNDSGLRIQNFEMESSALFALGRALGHQCATICLGVANRPRQEFSTGYEKEMQGLIQYVLDRI
jgi:uridine phosphorylase